MGSSLHADLGVPPRLSGRRLAHLVESGFASAKGLASSFRDAFHTFAETCLTRSLEDEALLWRPALEAQAVDALADAFSNAVTSGALLPLRFPVRLTAALILTSLATLQQQVMGDVLAPAEAADLLTTLLFDGLQAS